MWHIIIFLFTLLTFFAGIAQAAFSFEIDSVFPERITSKEQEVLVKLKITDLPSESYFRVSFQKNDKARYFGFIKNDREEWVEAGTLNMADCNKFYYVSDLTTEHLEIYLRLGKENIEPGVYSIKAHRYTSSCGSSPKVSENSVQVEIFLATPFPSPTPSPSPTTKPSVNLTLSPTPTLAISHTIKPSPLPVSSPRPTPTPAEFARINSTASPTPDSFADRQASPTVLGIMEDEDTESLKKRKPLIAITMAVLGIGLLGFSIISIV